MKDIYITYPDNAPNSIDKWTLGFVFTRDYKRKVGKRFAIFFYKVIKEPEENMRMIAGYNYHGFILDLHISLKNREVYNY